MADTMIYAFDRALEGSLSLFGAPLVGIMSEKMFAFDSNGTDHIKDSGRAAEALSKGILSMVAFIQKYEHQVSNSHFSYRNLLGDCWVSNFVYASHSVYRTGKLYGISLSLILINLATLMQRADEKLIPSIAKDMKDEFNATLYDIGYLSFLRNIVQGLASPLAGFLVISYDRPAVFAVGCLCWVLSTVAVGASHFFTQVTVGVAVNGFGHAIVYPVLQSIIADSFKDSARGFGFGLWNLIGTAGAIWGTVLATVMAGHDFLGIPGWRCAFMLLATMSAMIGVLVFLFATDPRKMKNSSFVSHDNGRSVWKESWVAIKDVTKLQTFQVIVLQGIVGLVPWNAMVFWTMWFELIGFDHNETASLSGMFTTGQAIGSLVGGIVADKMSRIFPNSGRVMCAQFSVFMGAIFSIILLRIIPQSTNSYYIYLVTLFLMGLTITWCGPAINSPILAEIVPPTHRTMIYAFDRALEVSFSSFGAPLVGIMSEKVFGFDAEGIDNIKDSGREAEALSKGIMWMMAVPFVLCGLCYTPLHFLFRKDRKIDRTPSSREAEMI
ncbi:hypothetical protein Bca52824_016648 [Brassica carinata]|uniref:Major facilitator superfamily (MFS) profile domain-containing protein n=1 Tax=Brassica carinata TaxID=52824 RepID=A0A8X7W6U1_BRACI|nr:hypothetical protein Bca52824_016648 [Brassica carinata]